MVSDEIARMLWLNASFACPCRPVANDMPGLSSMPRYAVNGTSLPHHSVSEAIRDVSASGADTGITPFARMTAHPIDRIDHGESAKKPDLPTGWVRPSHTREINDELPI
jgi:hypothetical protein